MLGGPEHRPVRARIRRAFNAARVDPAEAKLAGTISGVLFVMGGLTLAPLAILPGVSHAHIADVLIIAAAAFVWGVAEIWAIRWESAPAWVIHFATTMGLVLIGVAVASSGGADSPAWVYLFSVALFTSYFHQRTVAFLYLAGCVVAHALPLLYDPRATHSVFIAQYVIAGPAYVALGVAIIAGKSRLAQIRAQAEDLAAEQSALRRVATAVVGGEPPERVYELVAIEAAQMLGANAAGILRLNDETEATVLGSWADRPDGRYEPGTPVAVRPGGDVERALLTLKPVRIDANEPGSPVDRLGYSSSIVTPVTVGGSTWGVLAVTSEKSGALTAEDEERLTVFGDLLASAIASIEDRAKLAAQASTDPLTGLANHRTLQQRLADEAARAARHGRVLSVAVIDIDHFKQVNDAGGHEAGDEMLVMVANSLASVARAGDTIGRAGGDEFAWVLPDCTREHALIAVERVRRTIADAAPYHMSVSAGICDTTVTEDPSELINFADGALYWSKAHGRDQCWIYDPAVVSELSHQDRAERLRRSQALVGLRALARAIDAKDPSTREHSERVSKLAAKLAAAAGWSPDRTMLLGEAALVHDVGKIGVPEGLLRKSDLFTDDEREQIKVHAELAARIVEDVLIPEQVEWIRSQHERPDGLGYPRALHGEQIPEGAGLLALADAWERMTVSRPYGIPKTHEQALAECEELAGAQFTDTAVKALMKLHAEGDLGTDDEFLFGDEPALSHP